MPETNKVKYLIVRSSEYEPVEYLGFESDLSLDKLKSDLTESLNIASSLEGKAELLFIHGYHLTMGSYYKYDIIILDNFWELATRFKQHYVMCECSEQSIEAQYLDNNNIKLIMSDFQYRSEFNLSSYSLTVVDGNNEYKTYSNINKFPETLPAF